MEIYTNFTLISLLNLYTHISERLYIVEHFCKNPSQEDSAVSNYLHLFNISVTRWSFY